MSKQTKRNLLEDAGKGHSRQEEVTIKKDTGFKHGVYRKQHDSAKAEMGGKKWEIRI